MKSVNEWFDAVVQVSKNNELPPFAGDGRGLIESPRTNERGNAVYQITTPGDERYRIDFADKFAAEGWEQFDTDQDAHYFGVWVNRQSFRTLTYCEGDWTAVQCPDWEHYNAEIRNAIDFYGEGRIARVIDTEAETITDYHQDRAGFLVSAEGGAR